jgi:hypothetical protein
MIPTRENTLGDPAHYDPPGVKAMEQEHLRNLHNEINQGIKRMNPNNSVTETVNLQSGSELINIRYYEPAMTGDDAGRDAQHEQNKKFLASAQTRYTVAAGAAIDTPDGRLTAGMECDLVRHLHGSQPTANRLVSLRVLVELDPETLRARTSTARYRIAPAMFKNPDGPKAITTRDGVLCVGDGILPRAFSSAGFEGRLASPGFQELPSFAGGSGVERFETLLASGAIIDRGPEFGPHYSGKEPEPTAPAAKGKAA